MEGVVHRRAAVGRDGARASAARFYPARSARRGPLRAWSCAGAALLLAGCADRPPPAPVQPIVFNHAKHARQELECLDCHAGAAGAARAGLPALRDCTGCHFGTIRRHPEIRKLLDHFERRQPVRWTKVNVMPRGAMVRFEHAPHARAGVACAACHGDVAAMRATYRAIETADMGFCVDCHRRRDAGLDCLTCHR